MKRPFPRLVRALALLMAALLFTGCAPLQADPQPSPTAVPAKESGVQYYFNTVVTITLYGAEEGLMDEAWALCQHYENLLSKTVSSSDVSRINQAGGQSVQVDADTFRIIQRAKAISEETGGAFSITLAPIIDMWDFTGGTERMPTEEQRLAALPLVDDTAITLTEPNTVTLKPGMGIDLGGVAKGFIADELAALLRGRCTGAVINLGGNVYVVGVKPDSPVFRVGIQDPDGKKSDILALVEITDISLVTSGIYERNFVKDGVIYHHILDPKDGLPSQSDLSSATVVSTSSMEADAYATALIVMGKDRALQFMKDKGLAGVLVTRDRQAFQYQPSEVFQLQMLVDIPLQ